MHKVERETILVENRQRSGDLKSLRDASFRASIQTSAGLLHPVVVEVIAEGHRLVAGGRRLANIDWIAEDGQTFICDREVIEPGWVPVTFLHELDEIERREAELDENLRRSGLPWQDEVKALAEIHNLREARTPTKGVQETVKTLTEHSNIPSSTAYKRVTAARIIAPHLSDPAIAKARNADDAYNLVIRKEQAIYNAALVHRRQLMPSEINLLHGDCTQLLPTFDADIVDLIACDPPYAIDAGAAGFRSRTMHHHNYNDTIEETKKVISSILFQGFRIAKPRANLFLFCDIDLWEWISSTAERAGWTCFRTPIIWQKSESEGMAPWGAQGFRRTYELIFFATKGQRGLISSPIDVVYIRRVAKSERDYGAAKPVELMQTLIECSTLPNDMVIDPCCGSGATLLAAKQTKRRAIGIEKDQNAYNLALSKTANAPAPTVAEL